MRLKPWETTGNWLHSQDLQLWLTPTLYKCTCSPLYSQRITCVWPAIMFHFPRHLSTPGSLCVLLFFTGFCWKTWGTPASDQISVIRQTEGTEHWLSDRRACVFHYGKPAAPIRAPGAGLTWFFFFFDNSPREASHANAVREHICILSTPLK